ncbi:MAG: magnesium transporter CorA family protein [bacterium]
MISTHKNKNLTWVDLESPSLEELIEVGKDFEINTTTLNELLAPSERPKVDVYNNLMYLILHFPKYGYGKGKIQSIEIDFIIGKNFLITTHYETLTSMIEFAKIFETSSTLNKFDLENGGQIFFYLIKKMYNNIEEELTEIGERLQEIETTIFGEHGEAALEGLSRMNKELIDFRRSMRTHKEVFASLEKNSKDFFGSKFSSYTNALIGEHEKVWNILESNRETLIDLRQTSDSLFSARTNSVMRTLTVMTFITIPLSIIANMFGVNVENLPIVGSEHDFLIVVSLMISSSLIMVLIAKYKKWI